MVFRKHTVLLFLAIILLSSCSTKRMFTSLDVLRSAEMTFAPSIQNILIIDNSVVQAYNVGHNNYSSFYDLEQPKSVTLKFDSAALFCMAGLTENLEESLFFHAVKLLPERFNNTQNFYYTNYLNPELIKTLCQEHEVEAVMSLDRILVNDYLTYPGHNAYGVLDVNIQTKWSLYYPNALKRDTLNFVDEFSWEDDLAKRLPERYDALVDASILAGRNIADRLIPRWEKQDRYLFAPNRPHFMAEGMGHFTKRDWEKAIESWSAAEQVTSEKQKYQAYNNIAIAYEMLGDYESARLSLSKALQHYQEIISFSFSEFELDNVLSYWSFLSKREEELKLIDKQLGN